jgi:hypothetical protein
MAGNRRWRSAKALGVILLVAAVTGCGAVSGDPPTTATGRAGASPSAPVAPGAVWPSRDGSALVALQDLADRGRRPDLLDPVAVARQYAAAAMPGAAALRRAGSVQVTGRFTATGPTTGQVPVTGPGLSPSTVYLRRLEPEAHDTTSRPDRSIWYIQGVGTPTLAVLDVDYDGQRLVASFIPAGNGTLTVRVTGLDERLLAEQVTPARAGHLNPVDIDAPGQPGLVVSATLAQANGNIAPREFRIGAPNVG